MSRTIVYTIGLVSLVVGIRFLANAVGPALIVLRVLQIIAIGQLVIGVAYLVSVGRKFRSAGEPDRVRRILRGTAIGAGYVIVGLLLLWYVPKFIHVS